MRIFCILLITALLLEGCSLIPAQQAQATVEVNEEGTPVPTPTRDPSGYQAVPARACMIADWPAMQSDKPQGDLLAWQPGTTNLAYMAPGDRSSWYTGELIFTKGPAFQEKISLAPAVLAGGDLTWSPSGSQLAFLAYRSNEGTYTVMTVKADGSGLTDLFPTDLARTDNRTSQKAILGWANEDTLDVMASCGEECRTAYSIQVSAPPGPVLTPTPVENYHDLANSLQIHRNTQEIDAKKFPKALSDETYDPLVNWSPNKQMAAYLDRRGLLWLLVTGEKIQYLLDIGLRDVYETQWSPQGDYIALRAEDRAFIFQVPCHKSE